MSDGWRQGGPGCPPDENTYSAILSAGKGDLFAEVGNQNDANPCFLPDLLFYFTGAAHGDYGYRFGSGGTFDRVIRSEWWSHRSH